MNPKTEAGMLRIRQEAPVYKWATPKSGEVAATLVPHALFNDAIDAVKGAAAVYFPDSTSLTDAERIEQAMPDALKIVNMQKATQTNGYRVGSEMARTEEEWRIRKELDIPREKPFSDRDGLFESGGW